MDEREQNKLIQKDLISIGFSKSMASPKAWRVMPALSITPMTTFFGLDKGKAHCFTIDQRLHSSIEDPDIGGWLGISLNRRQVPITFFIEGKYYAAELRLAIQDRSRPRIHASEDLPERRIYQFQWSKFEQTITAIKNMFWEAYEEVSCRNKNHSYRIVFHHLGNNVFLLFSTDIDSEFASTLIHRNQA